MERKRNLSARQESFIILRKEENSQPTIKLNFISGALHGHVKYLLNRDSGTIIGLIKPQFETSKNEIKKGGIIKDEKVHQRICSDFEKWFKNELSMNIIGIALSPILGQKGNKEFLIAADFN